MKAVDGYEGRYSVTKCGKVYSHLTSMFKKLTVRKDGYLSVTLSDISCKKKTHLVHRLVAKTYIDEVYGKYCVNHIDGDKSNNVMSNLEWCTHAENNAHYLETIKEEKSYNSYPDSLVSLICKYTMDGWRRKDISDSLGISLEVIRYILDSGNYDHIKEDFDWTKRPNKRQSLSDSKVIKICELLERGETSYGKIIEEVGGINKGHIYAIKKRICYKYISDSFHF